MWPQWMEFVNEKIMSTYHSIYDNNPILAGCFMLVIAFITFIVFAVLAISFIAVWIFIGCAISEGLIFFYIVLITDGIFSLDYSSMNIIFAFVIYYALNYITSILFDNLIENKNLFIVASNLGDYKRLDLFNK
jgi:hypothetical protein